MNADTPRTEMQIQVGASQGHAGYVHAAFASVLEMELSNALAELAELRKDKARLDWLEAHSYRYTPDNAPPVYVIAHSSVWPPCVLKQLRAAIDAAIAQRPAAET